MKEGMVECGKLWFLWDILEKEKGKYVGVFGGGLGRRVWGLVVI